MSRARRQGRSSSGCHPGSRRRRLSGTHETLLEIVEPWIPGLAALARDDSEVCIAKRQSLHPSPMQPPSPDLWHGTTILTVRKGGTVAIGGDGQVSIGQTIVKANARKVRRLGKGRGAELGDVIGGFAGATADA